MRGHRAGESELVDFVSARTAELHRTAYLLTADQDRAERLVESAIDRLRRDRTPLGQAGVACRHYMARLAAAATEPGDVTGDHSSLADQQRDAIAGLSPRQRAVLMLRSLDRFDERSTARELGVSSNAVATAETEATAELGIPIDSDRCHTVLVAFAERATWPDPAVTVAAAAQVTPPRRRLRRQYVAVGVVLAVGAAATISSQVWHDHWLRTPDGINASHGTHFHAYVQGFKLVGVQRVPAGSTGAVVSTSSDEAIALSCRDFSAKSPATWPTIDQGDGWEHFPCAAESATHYFLEAAAGKALVKPPSSGHQAIAVARYKQIPWDRYPVAKDHFEVEHDQTLTSLLANRVGSQPAAASGPAVTMTGTNGVFSGRVQLPAPVGKTELYLTGLLSPTSTGRYRITVDGHPQLACGPLSGDIDTWCELADRYIPQVPLYSGWSSVAPGPTSGAGSALVRIEVRDARAPWKLQLRYGRYRYAN